MNVVHLVHVLQTEAEVNEDFPDCVLGEVLVATVELFVGLQILDDVGVQVANLAVLDHDVYQRLDVVATNE